VHERTYCCNVELLHAWQLPHGSRCSCHLLPQHPLELRGQVNDFYQMLLHPSRCIVSSVAATHNKTHPHCIAYWASFPGVVKATHPARHEHQPIIPRIVHQQHGTKVQSHDLFGATQSYVRTSVAKRHQPKP
jgi:hypothetical protein